MTERTVATYGEWDEYANNTVDPRARAVGVLADEISARVGGNKHVPIWLTEEVETIGCGDGCCNDSWSWLVIEAGEHRVRLSDEEDKYRYWLDEPRRQAEREAA